MAKDETMQEKGRQGGRSWRLSSPEAARKKLASLLTEFHRNPARDPQRFRAEVYCLSVILQYFNHERESEAEKRLAEIERRLGIHDE
jgi:hypothetical protein